MAKRWNKSYLFWTPFVLLLLLGSPVAFVLCQFHKADNFGMAYEQIYVGQSKPQVQALMGKPWRILPESADWNLWFDSMNGWKQQYACAELHQYGVGITVQQWVIGFNRDGRVVAKEYYCSP